MQNKQDHSFHYTYSASEQAKIREIRSKYEPKEESKLEQLKRLDASATQKANMYGLIVGVAGTLILGLGMSCCLALGGEWFIPGLLIGLVGMVLVGCAYPLYDFVLKRERKRIAPQILQLADELMK